MKQDQSQQKEIMDERDTKKARRILFAQFLNREKLKLALQNPGEPIMSQVEFAQYLGIEEWELSSISNCKRDPSRTALPRIAEKLGPEAYDIMGVPRKMPTDPLLRNVADDWHKLNATQRKEILERVKNMQEENQKRTKGGNPSNINLSPA